VPAQERQSGTGVQLEAGLTRDPDVHERSARAMTAADRATRQIERLLAFSRRQRLAPESVDINALVAGMTDLLECSLGSAIALHRVLAPALPPVRIDPGQLEDALMNLAINARDAMQGQGRIDFTTTRLADGTIEIAVSDTGCGMSPELAERVFEPFFTTKPAGKGSGLGLSMVYGFVRQSGGSIAIDSAPGQGTRIRIRLPAAAPASSQGPTTPGAAVQDTAPRGAGETILVVDDDPDLLRVTADQLRALGYRVLTAADGGRQPSRCWSRPRRFGCSIRMWSCRCPGTARR